MSFPTIEMFSLVFNEIHVRGLSKEKDDHVGDIIRRNHDLTGEALSKLSALHKGGVDSPRAEIVYAHPALFFLEGEGPHHAEQPGLAGAVAGLLGVSLQGGGADYVDDLSPGLPEGGKKCTGEGEGSQKINLKDLTQLAIGHSDKVFFKKSPRVINESGNWAKLLQNGFGEPGDSVRLAEISGGDKSSPPGLLHCDGEFLQRGPVSRNQRHPGTSPAKAEGRGAANPTAGARKDDGFAGE